MVNITGPTENTSSRPKANPFMDFMKHKGKIGGQHKFPRVLKGSMLKDWQSFLDNY